MDVKYFLKVLEKEGYPNPDVQSIAKMVGYNLDYFLSDLKEVVGENAVGEFCEKAVAKLTGNKGIRVDLEGSDGDEYVYVHIYPIFYDEDESENDIISNHAWGESRILGTNENGDEEYMTIQEIIDNTGMGEWSELDDLLDHIKYKAYNTVFNNCGFGIWWR